MKTKFIVVVALSLALTLGVVSALDVCLETTTDGLTATLTCKNDFGATVYDWNLGDGTTLIDVTDQTIEHTYAADGVYGVWCAGWSVAGRESAWTLVMVEADEEEIPEPPAYGTEIVIESLVGYEAVLTCENDMDAHVYDWSFGDGTELLDVTDKTVEHTFPGPGYYEVFCSPWTPEFGSDEAFRILHVGDEIPGDEEPPEECEECQEQYTLSATKMYNPSSWFDDSRNLCEEQELAIPYSVEVVAGNAGNHWAFLTFENAEITTCFYQGGSDQAHPDGPEQLALGEQWEFVRCQEGDSTVVPPTGVDLGLMPGDTIFASAVALSVNGDSHQNTTTSLVTIHNAASCEEPPVEPMKAELVIESMDGRYVTYTCNTNFDAMTYDWNFGDGMYVEDTTDATVMHTYAEVGEYGVWCAGWRAGVGEYGDWQLVTVG